MSPTGRFRYRALSEHRTCSRSLILTVLLPVTVLSAFLPMCSLAAEEAEIQRRKQGFEICVSWRTPPPQATLQQVPEHLKAALVEAPSRRCPPAAALAKVLPSDGPWLAEQYRQQRQPAQVATLAWCLVYAGEREGLTLLLSTIRGQQWKKVDGLDKLACQQLVLALGVHAQESDAAYKAIQDLTLREWWTLNSPFAQGVEQRFNDAVVSGLVGQAYLALGLSGRSEARSLIQRLRAEVAGRAEANNGSRPELMYREQLMLAECYLSVFERVGRIQFREHLFDTQFEQWCVQWGRTEAGRSLLQWAYPLEHCKEAWEDIDGFLALHSCPRPF